MPPDELLAPAPGDELPPDEDDTLTLLFLCAHPALSPASQLALTLRAVGGLTTAEIARALPRPGGDDRPAHQPRQAADQGERHPVQPAPGARACRAPARRPARALPDLQRGLHGDVRARSATRRARPSEAIRLTREVRRLLPDDGEVAGLLALMLLTDARRAARTAPTAASCRSRSRTETGGTKRSSRRASTLVTDALPQTPLGPYQLQAAIAAVHAEAARAEDTDWPQILALYELLERISPNPMVTLNRAVAVAMVQGPRAGLELLQHARRRRHRGAPPPRRSPRTPARDGRRPRGRPIELPDRGAPDDEPPRAALPRGPS